MTGNSTGETLLQRLFLDAQEEFLAAVGHVPNPGRGGSIGSLNPAGWTVMHVAEVQSGWIREFAAAADPDPDVYAWFERSHRQPPGDHTPPYDEARATFQRVSEDSVRRVMAWSWEDLLEPATLPADTPPSWQGQSRAYLVARSIAHAFVHAGELSVVASLMAAGDLNLPGALPHSSPPSTEDDGSVPVVAALARDAFVEVRRAAIVTPTPAVTGAMDRLNPVSHTLAHVLHREDRLWNQIARGNPQQTALAALLPDGIPGEPTPLDWGACLEALDGVEADVGRWLATVTPALGATPMKWSEDSSYAPQIARSAAHLFSHAGEMMAHASLYGVADIGMPGALAHVRAASESSQPA